MESAALLAADTNFFLADLGQSEPLERYSSPYLFMYDEDVGIEWRPSGQVIASEVEFAELVQLGRGMRVLPLQPCWLH